MKYKKIEFIIFSVVIFIVGIFIWKKITHKSEHEIVEEICQEKAEQFYSNQESFEKIVEYVNEFDFHSITENNEMWGDVIIGGVKFNLQNWESNYTLSLYPTKELLSQLMDNEEGKLVANVIGEKSDMDICFDKRSYNIATVFFSIEDKRLEHAMACLIWNNSDYEPRGDWIYQLNDNWMIAFMWTGH